MAVSLSVVLLLLLLFCFCLNPLLFLDFLHSVYCFYLPQFQSLGYMRKTSFSIPDINSSCEDIKSIQKAIGYSITVSPLFPSRHVCLIDGRYNMQGPVLGKITDASLPQLPVVESFVLSTSVKEDFCCRGQQLMKKLITGHSTESDSDQSQVRGHLCLPPSHSPQPAHHIKQEKKDVRAGRWKKCCVMLSSRYDMAVRHKLKPDQNPRVNKERGSEARFLAEDTLRAEGCWGRESHSSMVGTAEPVDGPTPMPTWTELSGLSELLFFRTWNG